MPALAPRNWFPDDRPGKPEIAIAAVLLFDVAYDFYSGDSVVWSWFAAGFLACVLTLGPVASSRVGARIDDWFQRIGVTGRVLVIVAVAVAVWAGYALALIPSEPASSAANGLLVAVAIFVAVRALYARVSR